MTSHRSLAAWYLALGQSLEAGLPLLESLETTGGPRPRERQALAKRLRDGAPLASALPDETWLPATDVQLLLAGAQSGRLPATCLRLAAHHELVARMIGRALLALAYPGAVLHLGVFLLPLQKLVMESFGAYALAVAGTLIPLWMVIALIAIPVVRHPALRRRVLAVLPGFAGYQKARDLHALASVLEGFVSAGVLPSDAWPAAGAATGAPRLATLGQRLGELAAAGHSPGAQLLREPDFPTEYATLYRLGEQSGKLDENLAWIARQSAERAESKLKMVSLWYPQLVFLGVAAWVAIRVIAGYGSYLNEILKMLD